MLLLDLMSYIFNVLVDMGQSFAGDTHQNVTKGMKRIRAQREGNQCCNGTSKIRVSKNIFTFRKMSLYLRPIQMLRNNLRKGSLSLSFRIKTSLSPK